MVMDCLQTGLLAAQHTIIVRALALPTKSNCFSTVRSTHVSMGLIATVMSNANVKTNRPNQQSKINKLNCNQC
jgi:hypothetical protein